MDHTDVLRSERVRDRLAVGYAYGRGRLSPVPFMEIAVAPAGSIFSCVEDMARYVAALTNGGANENGRVLRSETLALMLERQYGLDPRLQAMGLAFILDRFGDHRIAWHNGGWIGFISSMLVAPDDDLGVVVFTNTSSPAPDVVAGRLLRSLLGVDDPARGLPRKDVLERPDLWPEMVGDYGPTPGPNTNLRTWLGFGGEVRVRVTGNHLELAALVGPLRKGLRLYPTDRDDSRVFSVEHEGQVFTVIFGRGQDGAVDRLHMGMNTFHKRPTTQSVRFRALAGGGAALGVGLSVVASKLRRR
jgi:hypothetical protein